MHKNIQRCEWVNGDDELMIAYHDDEWGVPLHDDDKLFEFLCLESFQAGLSWKTILYKRENFRQAFALFSSVKVARFSKKDIERLMNDTGIVRNRLKIESSINNAKRFLEVQKEFGKFATYVWSFVDNKTINHNVRNVGDVTSTSEEAISLAKDLKKRGFKFLGPTTVYAFMQATGMVNDHLNNCFKK